MMGFKSRQTMVSGVGLHWVEAGEGRPLVLVHGLGDTHRTWHRTLPHLARGRRVLAIDLPGHGLSQRPDASYDLSWHARLVGQWCDYLELNDFDLVGHSYGAGVAQFLLLSHGHRVRRLGLVAAGGLGREVHASLRLMSVPLLPRIVQPLMRLGTSIGVRLIGTEAFTPSERAWLARLNARPGSGRAFLRTTRGVIGLRGQTTHFLDHARRIPELPPIAMFWGDRDVVVPIEHGRRALEFLEDVALEVFKGSGHFPHLSQAERFADALTVFLDDPDRVRATMVPPVTRLGRLVQVTRERAARVGRRGRVA